METPQEKQILRAYQDAIDHGHHGGLYTLSGRKLDIPMRTARGRVISSKELVQEESQDNLNQSKGSVV